VPDIFAAAGDRHAAIDDEPGSLEALLELSARHEREGLADAPWPPHYARQAGEPPRVQPSRTKGRGRRVSSKPLIEVARAAGKDEALAGLERWKSRHPEAAAHLQPADVLVDAMRGRNTTWTRIRVNLEHVPPAQRPSQEPLEVDYDPWAEWQAADRSGQRERPSRRSRGDESRS
jgi:bifunctional non-homologous end joining protein LigD